MPGLSTPTPTYQGPPSGAAANTPQSAYPWLGGLSKPVSPAWVPGGYTFDSVLGRYVKTDRARGAGAANTLKGFTEEGGPDSLAAIFKPSGFDSTFALNRPSGAADPFSASSSSVPAYTASGGAGGAGGAAPTVAPVDTTAAHAAAFARAKDEAAQTAAASIRALQGSLASRGMAGGGYEAGQIGTNLAREANTIGEASRSEAIDEAGLREREAGENQRSALTTRGQDIEAANAAAQRNLEARGQDITTSEAAKSRSLQAMLAQLQGQITTRGQMMPSFESLLQGLFSQRMY